MDSMTELNNCLSKTSENYFIALKTSKSLSLLLLCFPDRWQQSVTSQKATEDGLVQILVAVEIKESSVWGTQGQHGALFGVVQVVV